MHFVDFLRVIRLLPMARKHLLNTQHCLSQQSYQAALLQPFDQASKLPIPVIVKSYFWACRLIPTCQCLPRSIALYQHLKAAGHEVTHRFGVNKQDQKLAAHAWVEYQQQPLNEAHDLKQRFTIMH